MIELREVVMEIAAGKGGGDEVRFRIVGELRKPEPATKWHILASRA